MLNVAASKLDLPQMLDLDIPVPQIFIKKTSECYRDA